MLSENQTTPNSDDKNNILEDQAMTGGLHLSGAKEPFAINDDLWKHRSSKMRCRTCMWFVRKNSGLAEAVKDIGRCRKNAPTMSGYPVVFVDDWCGNHKIDEVKF